MASASYHVWALFKPGECERRVSCPLAVEADVGVDIDCFRLRLHQQDRTDWRQRERERWRGLSFLLRLSNNAAGLKGRCRSEKRKQNSGVLYPLWLQTAVEWSGPPSERTRLNELLCDSQWTSTRMLTLVFPTALKTRQETGSVKKEWSALVVNTLSLAPCSTTPPLAHLGFKQTLHYMHQKKLNFMYWKLDLTIYTIK